MTLEKVQKALEDIIEFMPEDYTPNSPFVGDRYQDGADDAFYKAATLAKEALAELKEFRGERNE
ncbi:MAG: hypothetical protein Unbinned5081contig1002_6 [Prokaryotic dsDNA virus sp.]|nr:MAG: hypothetical protein Unbinned5081contig1002_6 [Prokaryotic dsDNA virus sp.]|tara:strand:+ start:5858 stop:6049 length:192 start_codon:yes stop_codon:yes gene_type:complete